MKRAAAIESGVAADVDDRSVKRAKTFSDDPVLSESQQRVVKAAVDGESFFFTGAAGTGKSFVIKHFVPMLQEKFQSSGGGVYITASTGVAACNIGGVTLHSFAGIGLGEESAVEMLLKLQDGKKPPLREAADRWADAKVLIIEECSMISAELFEKLDFVARNLRKDSKSLPFGGIQVILCGDFFQLPPVNKKKKSAGRSISSFSYRDPEDTVDDLFSGGSEDYIFETKTWKTLVGSRVYILDNIYRQKDSDLLVLLHDVRLGAMTDESRDVFMRCKSKTMKRASDLPSDMVRLFSTRKEVEAVNSHFLYKLDGEEMSFTAKDTGTPATVDRLSDQWMSPRTLELKVGASVMFIVNDRANGVVNGTTGKVTKFVKLLTGKYAPEVRINGSDRSVIAAPHKWEIKVGKKTLATRTQIPVILAYAITIHKSQGLGIDTLVVNTGKIFEYGQLYTALSRATNIEGLYIIGPIPSLIEPNPKVLAWWNGMKAEQKQ